MQFEAWAALRAGGCHGGTWVAGPLTWVGRCAFTTVNRSLGVVYLGGEVKRQAVYQGGPVCGCGPADGVVDPFSGQLTHPAPLEC